MPQALQQLPFHLLELMLHLCESWGHIGVFVDVFLFGMMHKISILFQENMDPEGGEHCSNNVSPFEPIYWGNPP